MNRQGAALFVALVVVLLGELVVVLASMVAAAEIRAGTVWSEQGHASSSGASAAARALASAAIGFPALLPGQALALDDTVTLTRLSDSVALVAVQAPSRMAMEAVNTVARTELDTAGAVLRLVPLRSRARYHPIP